MRDKRKHFTWRTCSPPTATSSRSTTTFSPSRTTARSIDFRYCGGGGIGATLMSILGYHRRSVHSYGCHLCLLSHLLSTPFLAAVSGRTSTSPSRCRKHHAEPMILSPGEISAQSSIKYEGGPKDMCCFPQEIKGYKTGQHRKYILRFGPPEARPVAGCAGR